ncbi:MAG TPA: CBS domain-containing protein [Nitrososphaerales archaeon]|nr:CBS domain-containing protein [Nitrososphaerales archaeon]
MVLYARDIVEKDFLTISPDTTVLQGARAMKDSKHGFALVGPKERPHGIVTEWDILSQVVAESKDPSKVTMGEIMSKDLVFVEGSAGLSTVSQIMTQKGVRRLLVVEKGVVTGVITAKEMMARMNEYVDKISSQISRLQAPWF